MTSRRSVLGLSGLAAASLVASPPAAASVRIPKAGNLRTTLSSSQRFIASIEPSTSFEVELEINVGPGVITSTRQTSISRTLWSSLPKNLATGPIEIVGARPGDLLTVAIESVEPSGLAYCGIQPGGGLFPDFVSASSTTVPVRVMRIENGLLSWRSGLGLRLSPLIGTIGVVPASGSISTLAMTSSGGNLDVQEIAAGASVSFIVRQPGARLFFGDTHGAQGDTEAASIGGIECASLVRARCSLSAAPAGMVWPRIENATHIAAVGIGSGAVAAARAAFGEMMLWLRSSYGFGRNEAYMFLSGIAAEARATSLYSSTNAYVCKVARQRLP